MILFWSFPNFRSKITVYTSAFLVFWNTLFNHFFSSPFTTRINCSAVHYTYMYKCVYKFVHVHWSQCAMHMSTRTRSQIICFFFGFQREFRMYLVFQFFFFDLNSFFMWIFPSETSEKKLTYFRNFQKKSPKIFEFCWNREVFLFFSNFKIGFIVWFLFWFQCTAVPAILEKIL